MDQDAQYRPLHRLVVYFPLPRPYQSLALQHGRPHLRCVEPWFSHQWSYQSVQWHRTPSVHRHNARYQAR